MPNEDALADSVRLTATIPWTPARARFFLALAEHHRCGVQWVAIDFDALTITVGLFPRG